MRELNQAEKEFIADVLRRLREHFHEWKSLVGGEHQLVGFAYYEGCGRSEHCSEMLLETAPFALGAELVARYGFTWVMIDERYGVKYPALGDPIDLLSLENGSTDEPGWATHNSLEAILASVGLTPLED